MEKHPTISPFHFKRHIALYEKHIGPFDYDYYQNRYGISKLRLSYPEYRVPLEAATDFFLRCARETNDPCFGLTWAQKAAYNVNDQIVRSMAAVPDVRSFFYQNIRVSRLTSELASFDLLSYDDEHHLLKMNLIESVPTCYHQVDATMLYVIRATRFILRARFPETQKYATDFRAVMVRHACPAGMEEVYQKNFGIPVLFEQEHNGLLMVNEWLDVRLMPGQTSVNDVVACEVENLRLTERHSHKEIAEQCVVHLLPYGAPGREEVAKAMNMSLRTFQRKLKEEGHSYQSIVETVRKRLAKDYIDRDCYPLEEVAFLLGYSNITAFYAAYRRWFNSTPRSQDEAVPVTERAIPESS